MVLIDECISLQLLEFQVFVQMHALFFYMMFQAPVMMCLKKCSECSVLNHYHQRSSLSMCFKLTCFAWTGGQATVK
jgi:hypothetical protein